MHHTEPRQLIYTLLLFVDCVIKMSLRVIIFIRGRHSLNFSTPLHLWNQNVETESRSILFLLDPLVCQALIRIQHCQICFWSHVRVKSILQELSMKAIPVCSGNYGIRSLSNIHNCIDTYTKLSQFSITLTCVTSSGSVHELPIFYKDHIRTWLAEELRKDMGTCEELSYHCWVLQNTSEFWYVQKVKTLDTFLICLCQKETKDDHDVCSMVS